MPSILDSLKQVAGIAAEPTNLRITSPRPSAGKWSSKRKPLTDRDRVLISQTHVWLRQIPGPYQPKQLCRHYPRVANEIARCWDEPLVLERLLNDLTVDKRGDRAGFAPRIVQELHVLREFRARRHRTTGRVTVRLRKIFGGPAGTP